MGTPPLKFHFMFLALLVGGLLTLAGCGTPETPAATAVPTMGNNNTPSFQEIRAQIVKMWQAARNAPTPASSPTAEAYEQQAKQDFQALVSSLKGKEVQGWRGWVVKVKEEGNGRYLVAVDMDEFSDRNPFLGFEYRGVRRIGLADVLLTGVTADQVNGVTAGDRVELSGLIEDLAPGRDQDLRIDPANGRLALTIDQGRAVPVATGPKTPGTEDSDVVITLTRPICGMASSRCYTYDLTVRGDGSVLYSEEDWDTIDEGNSAITKTYQVSQDKVRELVAEFDRIGYFSLKDDYESFDISDSPAATTSITRGTKRKSIFHYYGDRSAPDELAALEAKIDQLIGGEDTPTP